LSVLVSGSLSSSSSLSGYALAPDDFSFFAGTSTFLAPPLDFLTSAAAAEDETDGFMSELDAAFSTTSGTVAASGDYKQMK